jgi:hypothetical protein
MAAAPAARRVNSSRRSIMMSPSPGERVSLAMRRPALFADHSVG